MKIGAVIPAFNATPMIGQVLDVVLKYLDSDMIFLIDDGSQDLTAEKGEEKGVIVYKHERNRGKGKALKTGFQMALSHGVESVFTIDADGQHNPDYIPDFIKCMQLSHCDMVVGKRDFHVGKMPLDRIVSNTLSSLLVSLVLNTKIPDSQCGFRLIRTDSIKKMKLSSDRYEVETELILKTIKTGGSITFLPIESLYCAHKSNIRRFQDSLRFSNLIIKSLQ